MSISQNCRTCLAHCKLDNMVSLFVEIEKNGKFIKNADLLMECTSIKVAHEDGYPQNICSRCLSKLSKAYKFKKECEYADKLLKNGSFIWSDSQNDKNDIVLEQTNEIGVSITDHEYLPVIHSKNSNLIEKLQESHNNDNKIYECTKIITDNKKILNEKINLFRKEIHNISDSEDINLGNEINPKKEINLNKEIIQCKKDFSKDLSNVKKCENKISENQINTESKTVTSEDIDQENDEIEYIFKFESKDVVTKLTQRTCNYCYTASPSFKQMCAHVYKQHKVKVTFGCTDCGEHFVDDKLFREHRNTKHSRLINNSEELNVVTDPYGNRWICCSTRFLNHQKLRSHVRSTHSTQLTYRCPVCYNKLQNLIELQRHMRDSKHNYVAPAKEHLCWLCGKQYILKTDFERHMRFHSGEKPYKCDDCGKTFTSHIYLYSHKSVHNKRSRKKCSICDKSYTSSSSLKYHMKLHTGVLDHPCSVCGRLFRTKREVREHMITHTGARDHECEFCGKKFGRKRNLMTHRKIHTGERPKVCHTCGASFIQSTSLRLHMKKHENNSIQ